MMSGACVSRKRRRSLSPTVSGYQNIFSSEDMRELFKNRYVCFIGDSVVRCMYYDFIAHLQSDELVPNTKDGLKAKGVGQFMNDVLVFRRTNYRTALMNDREFSENREFHSRDGYHLVTYYFTSRCYSNPQITQAIDTFARDPPDVVFMNSCLWDVTRWDNGEQEYKLNLQALFQELKGALPPKTSFVWLTTLPVASKIGSGVLLDECRFMENTLRVAILDANYYVAELVARNGFDILDLHFYIRAMIDHRAPDGVHWDAYVHRHITDLLCAFMHFRWKVTMPQTAIATLQSESENENTIDLPHLIRYPGRPSFLQNLQEKYSSTDPNRESRPRSRNRRSRSGSRPRRPRSALSPRRDVDRA